MGAPHILITGANTGIGKATALELARRGADLTLACRSEEKTIPVIEEIRAAAPERNIDFLALDLADLASVRASAAAYLADDRPIDVLINNAGLAGSRGLTNDGFELAFGVNHLGHFLFTLLLIERLRASAPSRIVNVSSRGHYDPETIEFDKLRQSTATIAGLSEYNVSKLCNVLFSQELARRVQGSGITTYSLHPGVIASDVWRRVPWPVRALMTAFMASTEDGARTSVHCALDEAAGSENGLYYDDCKVKHSSRYATEEMARTLWTKSEEWAGVTWEQCWPATT